MAEIQEREMAFDMYLETARVAIEHHEETLFSIIN